MMTCPKCRGHMRGPRYDGTTDRLVYTCGCGYSLTTLPADAKAPSVAFSWAKQQSVTGGGSS